MSHPSSLLSAAGQQAVDEHYMRRCLQLAGNGLAGARPNPMVGAVIVAPDGRIIGEGYHVRCGEGHAEVNAFASVAPRDEALLAESTIYVSLEPCSHFGRTPPCADLIVSKGVRRVVCGCIDPFAKVQGRGVERIRQAGIEVTVGVLERECLELNRRFITASSLHRPYVVLKWAQSADHYLDRQGQAEVFSSPYTLQLMHKLRAESDAILVGRVTDEREHPSLTVRHWAGKSPRRLVLSHATSPEELLRRLADDHCQQLMVEGGGRTLASFIEAGLWDELRVETAPIATGGGTEAPAIPPEARLTASEQWDGRTISHYRRG